MKDTPRNIHTKFGSYWSSSIRENFSNIVHVQPGELKRAIIPRCKSVNGYFLKFEHRYRYMYI